MKKCKQVSIMVGVFLAALALTSPAYAGSFSQLRITNMSVYNSSATPHVLVSFSAFSTSPASCATPLASHSMIFDATSNKGKVMLSMLTAAFLAGKPVSIYGAGGTNCLTPGGLSSAFEIANYAVVH